MQAFMMQSGLLAWHTMGAETDPDTFIPAIQNLGYPDYAPEPRSLPMSLKAALCDVYTHTMVRPLKNNKNDGYTVVSEVRGETENDYPTVGSAKVLDGGYVMVTSGDLDRERLQELTNYYSKVLPGSSVSNTVIQIALNQLKGISLKENGGLYFIPEVNAMAWLDVIRVTAESACGSSRNNMSYTPMQMNDTTLRDIRDALIREVNAEIAAIRKDLATNELGERAIANRMTRAVELHERVQFYSSITGEVNSYCNEAIPMIAQELAASTAQNNDATVFDGLFASV